MQGLGDFLSDLSVAPVAEAALAPAGRPPGQISFKLRFRFAGVRFRGDFESSPKSNAPVLREHALSNIR